MIALGGNSIAPKGGVNDIQEQFSRTREAIKGLSHFISKGYNLCLNHGNGPQVGNELMRMELSKDVVPPLPLGVCVASTQGSIGYMIQQSLQNKLREMKIDREVVTMISQVLVKYDDPSFKTPHKFVGNRYNKTESDELRKEYGWTFKEQDTNEFRRVVPSPMPGYLMHGKSIKALVDRGTIVIATGGGGIPVYNDSDGNITGLDAVIDKDYSAAKMGRIIRAQELWIITDIDCVYVDFGSAKQKRITTIKASEIEKLYQKGEFQKGTIAPKIKAALHFLKYHGEKVVITSIPFIKDAFRHNAGTIIRNDK